MPISPGKTFEQHRRFRRDRRLCAAHLRTLCAKHPQNEGGPLARAPIRRSPSSTGLNLGTIVESPMLNIRMVKRWRDRQDSAAAAAPSARWRNIFSNSFLPGDTFIFSGKVLRFEGIRENEALVSQALLASIRRSRPMPAASFRSRPISPTRCDRCSPIPTVWHRLPRSGDATGCRCRRTSSILPEAATSC